MYCTRCGGQNTDGSGFCTSCGASLAAQSTTAPPGGMPGAGYASGFAPSSSAAAPPRRLKRSMTDKKIAGVCAGFAEYFDMDVTLVRLIWAGASLMSGIVPGIMVYIVAWIILPQG